MKGLSDDDFLYGSDTPYIHAIQTFKYGGIVEGYVLYVLYN